MAAVAPDVTDGKQIDVDADSTVAAFAWVFAIIYYSSSSPFGREPRTRRHTHTRSQSWLTPFHSFECFRFFNFYRSKWWRCWDAQWRRGTTADTRVRVCTHRMKEGNIKYKSIWKIKCENIEFVLFYFLCVSIYSSPSQCALIAFHFIYLMPRIHGNLAHSIPHRTFSIDLPLKLAKQTEKSARRAHSHYTVFRLSGSQIPNQSNSN